MKMENSSVTRKNILDDITLLLTSFGFKTSNIYDGNCFDLLARKDDILIILKILVNIDSLTKIHAKELSKVSGTFLASPIIISYKSKHGYLEEDVVYERHELPVISPQTLCNIIVNDIHPEIFAKRGGYYVKIDGDLLKKLREKNNLSLKELADISHVSRETIYKYEQGNSQTYPETALMLEKVLNSPITVSINLLESDKPNTTLDEKIHEPIELIKLGYDIKTSNKTPFDAISERQEKTKEIIKLKEKLENKLDEIEKLRAEINKRTQENNLLITNMERNRNEKTLNKIANCTEDISMITGHDALFVLDNRQNNEFIKKIPAIYTWELKDMNKMEELLKLIKERKEEARES